MAALDFSEALVSTQSQLDRCLAIMHVIEALPMVSCAIMNDALNGLARDALVSRMRELHNDIDHIAILAKKISSRSDDAEVQSFGRPVDIAINHDPQLPAKSRRLGRV